ncbi:MAG: hypothetical protein JWM99_4061 [Verrucomicrobiales bacterium]|nr:hypothetical protein [Verrucomicrobiales bacterium]
MISNPTGSGIREIESDIPAHFQGRIRRSGSSFFYKCGLGVVAATMVILPLIYVGFIALAGWATYFHAVHNFHPIMNFGGTGGIRLSIAKFAFYITPLFAGVVLVLFMIKPLFAKRGPKPQSYSLNPESEPLLYSFIAKVCEAVGAPFPVRVDLNCQLNASAHFRRGFFSFLGNDLVLTIGLPLVAGLNTREFAGVLAHEFGHFTQGFGMRLTYVIRSINFWFARVVYERDSWDVTLEEFAQDAEDWRIAIVVGVARLGVWTSRRILELLMLGGHVISGFMLRQMEYDADLCEIRLAGSDAFESTVRRFALLGKASEASYKEMRVSWNLNRRLPDNFPAFMLQKASELPSELQQKLLDSIGLKKSGLMDTHPSDADRIRRARLANEPGIFLLELPARDLFQNFQAPARFVTLFHYTDDLGLPVTEGGLNPTPAGGVAPDESDTLHGSLAASAEHYFLGSFDTLPNLLPAFSELAPLPDLNSTLEALRNFDSQFDAIRGSVREACNEFDLAELRRRSAEAAYALIEAKIQFEPEAFDLSTATLEAASNSRAESLAAQQGVHSRLREVAEALRTRLRLVFSLLVTPVSAQRVSSMFLVKAREMLTAGPSVDGLLASCREIEREQAILEALNAVSPKSETLEERIGIFESKLNACTMAFAKLTSQFAALAPRTEGSLQVPIRGDLSQILKKAQQTAERIHKFRHAFFNAVATAAQRIQADVEMS